MTRSGVCSAIVSRAAGPSSACATTSTPGIWPRRKHNSSRASCSSSTTTVRSISAGIVSGRNARRHDHLRNDDARAGALAGDAIELELVVGAVDDAQALVDVLQPDAAAGSSLLRSACACETPTPLSMMSMIEWPFCRVLRMRMRPSPIFGDRPCLIEFSTSGCSSMLGTTTSRLAGSIDFSIVSFGPKRTASMSRYWSMASSSSRSVTKCSWLRSRRRSSPDSFTISVRAVSGSRPDERRDRRQRVEEEVRVDLAREGGEPRREQQLFLFLQTVLDTRAVPDLDGDGDAEDRGEHDEPDQPRRRRYCAIPIAGARLG